MKHYKLQNNYLLALLLALHTGLYWDQTLCIYAVLLFNVLCGLRIYQPWIMWWHALILATSYWSKFLHKVVAVAYSIELCICCSLAVKLNLWLGTDYSYWVWVPAIYPIILLVLYSFASVLPVHVGQVTFWPISTLTISNIKLPEHVKW